MKFKLGDIVILTAGKDKGKQGKITKILSELDRVVVEGVNLYTRHVKAYADRAGEKVVRQRPISTAKIAILNPETKKVDRIGYVIDKSGKKQRIFKKTGKLI